MLSRFSLYIAIAVLTVLAGVLGLLNFKRDALFQRAQLIEVDSPATSGDKPAQAAEENPVNLGPTLLTRERVIAAILNPSGNGIFYITADGNVWEISLLSGNSKKKLATVGSAVSEAFWSPRADTVITRLNSLSPFVSFNLASGASNVLHGAIRILTFHPQGDRIVYHFLEPDVEAGSISTSEANGQNFRQLFPTRIPQLQLYWLESGHIVFHASSHNTPVDVFMLQSDGRGLNKIHSAVTNPVIYPSRQGSDFFIVFQAEDGSARGEFWNAEGKQSEVSEGINGLTSCVWATDALTIFCGKDGEIGKIDKTSSTYQTLQKHPDIKPRTLILTSLEQILVFQHADGSLYQLGLSSK